MAATPFHVGMGRSVASGSRGRHVAKALLVREPYTIAGNCKIHRLKVRFPVMSSN